MRKFQTITYLKHGNDKQQKAYNTLVKLGIMNALKAYHPILTGTIPIEIDIPESDLDIICQCKNHTAFAQQLTLLYQRQEDFKLSTHYYSGIKSTICQFKFDDFEIEIFGQNIPTTAQNAYKHLLIEYSILKKRGLNFQSKIKTLKRMGMKTEPAFAKLLGLEGNPYEELLKLSNNLK